MLGHLIFRTYGVTVATQLLINGVGLGLMVVLAVVLEHRRRPVAAASATARTRDALRAPGMVENRLADRSAV